MCGFFSNVTGHLTNREFLLGMLLATLLLVIVFLVVKLICRCSASREAPVPGMSEMVQMLRAFLPAIAAFR